MLRGAKGGAPGGNRTPGLQVRSLSLYPTELRALAREDRRPEVQLRYWNVPLITTKPGGPAVWAEVDNFVGLPAWHILARPCISHIRVHAGEVETLLHAIRLAAPA